MNPETALALAKSYVKQTLDGAGALKGKDGVDGQNGADGNGIASIERTNGNGSSGSTDTYTITMTNGETYDFNVYNGADGKDGKDGADGSGGSGGSLEVYSTEEKVVGTWIDGRPVYQILVILGANYTIGAGKKYTLPINAENIAQIIKGEPVFISDTDSGVGSGSVWKSSDALIFSSWDGWDAQSDRTVCIVLRYTKTTDAATIDIPSAAAMMAAYEEGVQNA